MTKVKLCRLIKYPLYTQTCALMFRHANNKWDIKLQLITTPKRQRWPHDVGYTKKQDLKRLVFIQTFPQLIYNVLSPSTELLLSRFSPFSDDTVSLIWDCMWKATIYQLIFHVLHPVHRLDELTVKCPLKPVTFSQCRPMHSDTSPLWVTKCLFSMIKITN